MIDITYANLVSAINDGTLTAGEEYRITDYATTGVDTTSHTITLGNHSFYLVVTAISASEISHDARAIDNSNGYFDADGVAKWSILYDIANDSTKYDWADATNGKGVIYYLCDEHNNEAFFDFKNIIVDGNYLFDHNGADASVEQSVIVQGNRHTYQDAPTQYKLSGATCKTNGYNDIKGNDIDGTAQIVALQGGGTATNTLFACYNKVKGTAQDILLTGCNCEVYNGSGVTIVGNNNTTKNCTDTELITCNWVMAKECSGNTTLTNCSNVEATALSGSTLTNVTNSTLADLEDFTLTTCDYTDASNCTMCVLSNAYNVALKDCDAVDCASVTNSTFDTCTDVTTASGVTLDGVTCANSEQLTFSATIINNLLIEGIDTLTIGTDFATNYGNTTATIRVINNQIVVASATMQNGMNANGTLIQSSDSVQDNGLTLGTISWSNNKIAFSQTDKAVIYDSMIGGNFYGFDLTNVSASRNFHFDFCATIDEDCDVSQWSVSVPSGWSVWHDGAPDIVVTTTYVFHFDIIGENKRIHIHKSKLENEQ